MKMKTIITVFLIIGLVFTTMGLVYAQPPKPVKYMTGSLVDQPNGLLVGHLSSGACAAIEDGIVNRFGGNYSMELATTCSNISPDHSITLWAVAQTDDEALGFFFSKCYNGTFNISKNPTGSNYSITLTGQSWPNCVN